MKELVELLKELKLNTTNELMDAIEKHGMQPEKTLFEQYTIAGEEFGEIAKDILEGKDPTKECYQTIAMILKIIWLYRRNHGK